VVLGLLGELMGYLLGCEIEEVDGFGFDFSVFAEIL
jgi:hypothetical protein